MLDETMPGAALEAPETFRVLLAPFWSRLTVALGYPGPARWVALYVSSDHAMYTDGAWSGTGETALFLAYKRHPAVAPHLAGAHLGGADEDARDWLLVDQAEHLLYLAEVAEARLHLAAQWPRDEEPPLGVTAEELTSLRDAWHEAASPPDWHDRLAESLRESRANYRLMQQWLDQQRAGER